MNQDGLIGRLAKIVASKVIDSLSKRMERIVTRQPAGDSIRSKTGGLISLLMGGMRSPEKEVSAKTAQSESSPEKRGLRWPFGRQKSDGLKKVAFPFRNGDLAGPEQVKPPQDKDNSRPPAKSSFMWPFSWRKTGNPTPVARSQSGKSARSGESSRPGIFSLFWNRITQQPFRRITVPNSPGPNNRRPTVNHLLRWPFSYWRDPGKKTSQKADQPSRKGTIRTGILSNLWSRTQQQVAPKPANRSFESILQPRPDRNTTLSEVLRQRVSYRKKRTTRKKKWTAAREKRNRGFFATLFKRDRIQKRAADRYKRASLRYENAQKSFAETKEKPLTPMWSHLLRQLQREGLKANRAKEAVDQTLKLGANSKLASAALSRLAAVSIRLFGSFSAGVGIGVAIARIPAKVLQWSESRIEEQRYISNFSARAQAAYAKYDIQGLLLQQRTAVNTSESSAEMIKQTMALKEAMQPAVEAFTNAGNQLTAAAAYFAKAKVDQVMEMKDMIAAVVAAVEQRNLNLIPQILRDMKAAQKEANPDLITGRDWIRGAIKASKAAERPVPPLKKLP